MDEMALANGEALRRELRPYPDVRTIICGHVHTDHMLQRDGVTMLKTKTGAPVRSELVAFSDRIAELLSAADLVVSRAGAGTLAELIRCETPAILVPYPQAADDHQRANAAFFERQGGGIVVAQTQLAGLSAEVFDIIFNDWLLRQFRGNLQRMARANSLDLMLHDLEQLAVSDEPPRAETQPATA